MLAAMDSDAVPEAVVDAESVADAEIDGVSELDAVRLEVVDSLIVQLEDTEKEID